jgi:hypothetical protein
MTEPTEEHERTMAFAEIALGQMKALHKPATPRNYEVWYTYATGYSPSLNQTVNETLARNGTLTDADFEQVYATYISSTRLTDKIDTVGSRVMDEINQVMAMMDAAAGSASTYTENLSAVSDRLGNAKDREGLRAIVETLVTTASEMKQNNNALEARLNASREEINQLQENLAVVRNESLTDPLTGLANRKHFDQQLADTMAEAAERSEPLAGDGRHRPFQDLQRYLGSPNGRSGSPPCRHVAQAERQGPGHRRALRRRGVLSHSAEHRAALGAHGCRPHPPSGDVEGTDETLDRPEPRPGDDFTGLGDGAQGRYRAVPDRAGRRLPLRRQAQRPQPGDLRNRSGSGGVPEFKVA